MLFRSFCAWYLEMIKPEYEKPIDEATYLTTVSYFEKLLKMLHPFMPFITEELWHELNERKEKECIIIEPYPKAASFNATIIEEGAFAFEIVTQIRNLRNAKGVSPKEAFKLIAKSDSKKTIEGFSSVIKKLANLSELSYTNEKVASASSFLVGTMELFVPMEGKVDKEKEREQTLKDIEYQKGFLISVYKKLSNEKFVNSAPPQVIEIERKKKADAEAKIKSLEESLKGL